MKVLFATSELVPLVKTGGLADVSGSLPPALSALGIDVRVLLPGYAQVLTALGGTDSLACVAHIPAQAGLPAARLLEAIGPDQIKLLVLDCPLLFDRPGNPYLGPDGKDWSDNDLRFGLLSRVAALLASPSSPLAWHADVLHLNDWQTALAPVYLVQSQEPRAATLLTIHNMAYQGLFAHSALQALGLPSSCYHPEGVEFHSRLSFLKGGLAYADAINTVSPTYATEICTEALGFGLDGLLRKRRQVLSGILNGIDTKVWDPQHDTYIPHPFSTRNLAKKRLNKHALQERFGLPAIADTMLLGMVTRLVAQKGVDMVADIAASLARLPAQLLILGTGDQALENRLNQLAQQHPQHIAVRIGYDETLSHLIEAGADAFLMPSRFEPCGMNQMYSQRYGTLPIVCQTGGLSDSVSDALVHQVAQTEASGFMVTTPANSEALWQTVQRAHGVYQDQTTWRAMQLTAMRRNFSWDRSAKQYADLYARISARTT